MINKKDIEKVFKLLNLSKKEEREKFLKLSYTHPENKLDSKNYFILSTSNSHKEPQKNAKLE
jgi:hypothetical protein